MFIPPYSAGFGPDRAPLVAIILESVQELDLHLLEVLPGISIYLKKLRNYEFDTYRIQKHHSFVHYFEVCSHLREVVVELVHQVFYLSCFYFDDKRVWKLHVLSGNDEIISLRDQHFD